MTKTQLLQTGAKKIKQICTKCSDKDCKTCPVYIAMKASK